jgi:uncharacterized linocin/CFP29 family protein
MDLLRRNLAPLTEAAWEEIDETARGILQAHLTARRVVDFDGPHGLAFAAVNTGGLELSKRAAAGGVPWGLRQVLPLVEVRLGFKLSQMELDSISRGNPSADLGPLEDAARKVAQFEETAVYQGFGGGQIRGLLEASEHKPVRLPTSVRQLPAAVAEGVNTLHQAGVGGPYALVLNDTLRGPLAGGGEGGYPPRKVINDLLGEGPLVWSPHVKGGVLLSTRGGDCKLTVGQDIAIGYASHDRDNVELFFTESFTFRVLDPAAIVQLKPAGGGK